MNLNKPVKIIMENDTGRLRLIASIGKTDIDGQGRIERMELIGPTDVIQYEEINPEKIVQWSKPEIINED